MHHFSQTHLYFTHCYSGCMLDLFPTQFPHNSHTGELFPHYSHTIPTATVAVWRTSSLHKSHIEGLLHTIPTLFPHDSPYNPHCYCDCMLDLFPSFPTQFPHRGIVPTLFPHNSPYYSHSSHISYIFSPQFPHIYSHILEIHIQYFQPNQ